MPDSAVLPHPPRISRAWIIIAWIVAGIAMSYVIERVPLTRTQEARVLVGAREMLGEPPERWLIPQANGEPRLRKPPLAYWLSAASYQVFGYGVTQGRVPAMLSAWLTLAFTYLIGKRLFEARSGLYAAGCLFGSWLFFKYALLAETDGLVMCQMTVAAYALIRANEDHSSSTRWLYLTAVMAALMALTKGPPAGYVVLMVIALDVIGGRLGRGRWRTSLAWRSIRSGAVLLAVAIALPWYLYALRHADGGQLTDDLSNSMRGGLGHSGYFWEYLPMLLIALAPWTIAWLVAGGRSLAVLAGRDRAASDTGARRSLLQLYCWGGGILLPLLLWGNKQIHYLLPLIPPMMITTGWLLRGAVTVMAQPSSKRGSLRGAVRWILIVMLILAAASIPLPLFVGPRDAPGASSTHLKAVAAMAFTAAMLVVFSVVLKKFRLVETTIIAFIAALVILVAGWLPALEAHTPRTIAAELRTRFPSGVFVFRSRASLPICAEMGQVIPVLDEFDLAIATDDELARAWLVCIDTTGDAAPLPDGYREVTSIQDGSNRITIWVIDGDAAEKASADVPH
ncbi:MAG: glycosyltransferase family 39 protein [Burkholderiales bacterium]|nr:glycosyltransferase family 39 protein [Phycisphaerae bacterium]